MEQQQPWEVVVRMAFFDASAIVKMCLHEPGSTKVAAVLSKYGDAYTSWILIAEAFGVLKRRWKDKANPLSDAEYERATVRLLVAVQVRQLRAVDVVSDAHGPRLTVYLPDLIELRRRHPQLDIADALQFRAIREGVLKYGAGESAPRLVSADGDLLRAAKAEGIPTIDVRND
jgi:predicted nucleic acid-binding protein